MKTEVIKNFDLAPAIACLKRGEPVVFPTETVYGLGAPLFNEGAVRKIFTIKGRPLDNPLIAHIASLDEAKRLSDCLCDRFYLLAEAFWPGPLAIIVPRGAGVPELVSAGHPTIAIRMPSHPVARSLIAAVGEPLVAPSANLSGKPSPTCVEDVLEDLEGRVELVVDGGACEVGIESTVISLVHSMPTILRPGKITKAILEEVLGEPVSVVTEGPALSPGMKYRHYAPNTPVRLVYRPEDLRETYLVPTAKNVYAELRRADRMGLSQIDVFCDERVQKDVALMNRLLRAENG